MVFFWLIAGALVAGALLLLLPPLLRGSARSTASRRAANVAVYRDQLRELENDLAAGVLSRENYEEAKREIERRLLEDVAHDEDGVKAGFAGRSTAVVIGAAVPIVAIALYFAVGNFQALLPDSGADRAGAQAHGLSDEQIRELVAKLAARMEREPEKVEGWIMLGRAYLALGQFAEASRAYANAVARSAPDAALLADYADALAMAQGRRLEGEPEKIIARALALDPQNIKALALAGSAAFERRDFATAVGYWERILPLVPPDSEFAGSVQSSIAEAKSLAGQRSAPAAARAADQADSGKPQPAAGKVSGVVTLAPSLAARVAPTDTVFVFARAAEGPRVPLAIMRAQAKDLPLKFTLDDSSAMAPGMALSTQKRVVVGARVSKSGNATPQPGDLEGFSVPVEVGASNVAVVIDAQRQ
jgi:cytochrome c-type biogenesis protein CcmH